MSYERLSSTSRSQSEITTVTNIDTSVARFRSGNISEKTIEEAICTHGVNQGSRYIMTNEFKAAEQSIKNKMYIIWVPLPYCKLTSAASDGIRNGTSQCARVGALSLCLCGHTLAQHQTPKISPRGSGYIQPPLCKSSKCRTCTGFKYCPARPEEVGQWWLPRRKDFDLNAWKVRVRQHPDEYCCIGCEQKVCDHETIFEYEGDREHRGAAVGQSYLPLHNSSEVIRNTVNHSIDVNASCSGKLSKGMSMLGP